LEIDKTLEITNREKEELEESMKNSDLEPWDLCSETINTDLVYGEEKTTES
jgi:uncharacterized protein YwgA